MTKRKAIEIERVVVRGTNWVGDAVMTIPALRELRRVLPDAHITLVSRSWARDIFADADFINELLIYDREGSMSALKQAREWRRRKFDAALLFQNAFEAALIARLGGVPLRLGYATDGRGFLLTDPVRLNTEKGRRHEVFYYLDLVEEFARRIQGISRVQQDPPRMELTVSDERRQAATALLQTHGIAGGRPVVALCPGSTNSRAKRWPAGRYAALADRLITEANAVVVLVGAPEELPVSREVAAAMRGTPVMLTGATDLAQVVAVLDQVDLLVTNDTGPAHIAAALGRPTLVIFGPTDPTTTRPFSDQAVVIRDPPDCAPCMLRDCPIDHRCMTAISADDVFEHTIKALAAAAPQTVIS